MILDDVNYDFSWDLLKFTILSSHSTVFFEDVSKAVSTSSCTWRVMGASEIDDSTSDTDMDKENAKKRQRRSQGVGVHLLPQ